MVATVYAVSDEGSSLVMARSQLAPLKVKATIPRLELRALLLTAKLLKFVTASVLKTQERKVGGVRIFTDSTIALYWLSGRIKQTEVKGSRNVTNTCQKITQERSEICRLLHKEGCKQPGKCVPFDHVVSEENPADLATRGVKARKLMSPENIWWKGPDWLTVKGVASRSHWSPEETPLAIIEETNELNKPQPVLTVTSQAPNPPPLDFARFSSFGKLKRVMAYVRRFLRIQLKGQRSGCRVETVLLAGKGAVAGPLTAQELRDAEVAVLKMHQQAHKVAVEDPGNRLLQLFPDRNGVFRCGHCRLSNSELPYSHKFPIFVPGSSDDNLVQLIIRGAHLEVMHSGENHTLDAVRSNFWIVRARRAVRKVLRSCTACRKSMAAPFSYPAAPELPEVRITQQRPFKHTGLDYAGPFLVKQQAERVKVYVLLIMCMTTRAVHLEVTNALSTMAFLSAFRRFVSRRGVPEHVISDNAPTFHCASLLLKEGERKNDERFSSYLANQGISWSFTTPHAPWKGGIYERLVGMMKNCLSRTIGRKLLEREEFETVIVEVEAVLNSRPLVRLSNVREDDWRILRPSNLLMPMGGAMGLASKTEAENPEDEYLPPESSSSSILEYFKSAEIMLQRYWNLFQTSYINSLRGRLDASVKTGRTNPRALVTGEVVLLQEETTPRGSWPMGVIVECGVREATVRTSNGSVLRRPLNLLVPLEVVPTSEGCIPAEESKGVCASDGAPSDCAPEAVGKTPADARPLRTCKS